MELDLAAWLEDFRRLHQRARRRELAAPALRAYQGACDELAVALLRVQRLAHAAGIPPRRSLSVARMVQADLGFFDGTLRVGTRSLSARGFTAVLARAPHRGEGLRATLRLPGGDPLQGEARVLEASPQLGNALVTIGWERLPPVEVERLELLIFDTVLEQLAAGGPRAPG